MCERVNERDLAEQKSITSLIRMSTHFFVESGLSGLMKNMCNRLNSSLHGGTVEKIIQFIVFCLSCKSQKQMKETDVASLKS